MPLAHALPAVLPLANFAARGGQPQTPRLRFLPPTSDLHLFY